MIPIIIDAIPFEVYGDKTLWSPASANGAFVEAPDDYARLARALVCCDYDDRDGQTCVLDSQLHQPAEVGSAVHFPLRAGVVTMRAKQVMTGTLNGVKITSVLAWDDPLDHVLTTREAEQRFHKAASAAKKAIYAGRLSSRKSGGTHLVRLLDAIREWG